MEVNYHEVNSAQSRKSKTWSIQSSLMQDQATYHHTVQKYCSVSTSFIYLFIFIFWGGWGELSKLERMTTSKTRPTVLDKVFRKECGPSQRMHWWVKVAKVTDINSEAFDLVTCHDLAHYEWPIPIATVARSVDGLTAGLFGHSVTARFMRTDSLTPITFSVVNCL